MCSLGGRKVKPLVHLLTFDALGERFDHMDGFQSRLIASGAIAGIEAASQALGHSDLNTTLSIYGHQDASDLERAMEKYAEAKAGGTP